MSKWTQRTFWLLKAVAAAYWLWLGSLVMTPEPSLIEKLLVATAPGVVSLHFLQLMVFWRLLKPEKQFGLHVLATLLFGVFHLGPLYFRARAAR